MKKIFFILAILLASFSTVRAQTAFEKGQGVVNIGLGLPILDERYSVVVPPLSATYDHCLNSSILDGKGALGMGAYVGFSASNYNYLSPKSNISVFQFIIGPRGTFHYSFLPKLDTYAALVLGYAVVSYSNNNPALSSQISSSGFVWNLSLGARYEFTPKYAAFAELGYGISAVNVGVSIKL